MASDRTLLKAVRELLAPRDHELREQIAESRRLMEESRRVLTRAPAQSPFIDGARRNSPKDKQAER